MRPPGIAESLQKAVDGAYAHLRQGLAVLLRKAQMIEVFQTIDDLRQERLESLATDVVAGLPDHRKRFHERKGIDAPPSKQIAYLRQ